MSVTQLKPRTTQAPPPPEPEREIMTAEEVAKYLRCSKRLVHQQALQGKIPGKRIGNLWRFSRKTITSLL